MSSLPPLSSTNWPNNPGCPNGQNQQIQLSASFPRQNTVPSLTAAAVRGTGREGRTLCTPRMAARPQARTWGSQEAGNGAQGRGHISSLSPSPTHRFSKAVVLKGAPPAGEADATGSSIWLRMWLPTNCCPPYKAQQLMENVQPSQS